MSKYIPCETCEPCELCGTPCTVEENKKHIPKLHFSNDLNKKIEIFLKNKKYTPIDAGKAGEIVRDNIEMKKKISKLKKALLEIDHYIDSTSTRDDHINGIIKMVSKELEE